MADEQSTTPTLTASPAATEVAPASDVGGATSPETSSQESKRSSTSTWFKGLFGMGRPSQEDESHDQTSEDTTKETPAPGSLDELVTRLEGLSEDDLRELPRRSTKAARLIQAETDRREHKRSADEAAKNPADAATQAKLSTLETQERQVRASDPYRAAELRDQIDQLRAGLRVTHDQQSQLQGLVKATVVEYDKTTLQPLLGALPDAERAAVLSDVPEDLLPFEQRQEVVSRTLKALEKLWRADEAKKVRASLARNPAERKQVVLGLREEEDEPDLVTSAGAAGNNGKTDMNTYLRNVMGAPPPRRRR